VLRHQHAQHGRGGVGHADAGHIHQKNPSFLGL
jgi:hypothetical protein